MLGYTDAGLGAVILPYYAVLFVLAIPLVFLGTVALIAAGLAVAVAVPVLSHLVRDNLPAPRLTNPGFDYLVQDPLGLLAELSLTGYYPALPWITYLCAGLVVGRLTLSSARVARRLLAGGAALAVTASATSWFLLGPLGGRPRLQAAAAAGSADGDRLAQGAALALRRVLHELEVALVVQGEQVRRGQCAQTVGLPSIEIHFHPHVAPLATGPGSPAAAV